MLKTRLLIPADPRSARVRGSALSLAACGLLALPLSAISEEGSRYQQSHSYDVYLGIVPAAQTVRDPQLDRLHRTSGQDARDFDAATQHITVAVFRRTDGQRVEDADVRAEVVESDFIRVKRTEKPLNMRPLTSGATYCNFFDRHWPGQYRVKVTIREPSSIAEKVTFAQKW